jgi:hypothetical protein
MKVPCIFLILSGLINSLSCKSEENAWIRINQIGYRNQDIKVAVLLSNETSDLKSFQIVDFLTGKVVMTFDTIIRTTPLEPFKSCYRLPFNDSIASYSGKAGLKLINVSTGTKTNQDWTIPEKGKPYYSSDFLMKDLMSYEKRMGMNGYILLIHPGTDPARKDKFYLRIDSILTFIEKKNYSFHSFSEIN